MKVDVYYLEAAYVVHYCFAVQWNELAIARPYDVFNKLVCAIAEINFLALQACMITVHHQCEQAMAKIELIVGVQFVEVLSTCLNCKGLSYDLS
jgi:hypothetical protein